ncbi:MAG TPA: hypothetical protein DDW50_04285 [Firmicutes bacterium]|jgi:hypothetical protein|nr:hypothetical protein [Bacillota bacterium]
MRRKLYGIFSNIDDAKQALGNIKKESLNLADLTVIFADNGEVRDRKREFDFEVSSENLGKPPQDMNRLWPGLQSQNLFGIGKIQIGSSLNHQLHNSSELNLHLDESDLAVIGPQVKANKVAAIIETEVDLLPKLRFILESNGALILLTTESII